MAALKGEKRFNTFLTVLFALISIFWVIPVIVVIFNAFKVNSYVKTSTFSLPVGEMWAGVKNFVTGMTMGNYNFMKSVFYSFYITIFSTALILLCTSMSAWYVSRIDSIVSRIVYYLCVF